MVIINCIVVTKIECGSYLKNITKTAWTRLYNFTGTKWELPEDDALALKHVGAVNKEQYTKLSIKCVFVCLLYIYILLGLAWFNCCTEQFNLEHSS
jgi:hypothetical protein